MTMGSEPSETLSNQDGGQAPEGGNQLSPGPRAHSIGSSLRWRNGNGDAPLHIAAAAGDVQKVLRLLEDGAHPYTKDRAKNTALHHAADCLSAEVALLLLEHGADPSLRNSHGESSLDLACQAGNADMVEGFLGRGVNASWNNTDLFGALAYALWGCHESVISVFENYGYEVYSKSACHGSGYLHLAALDDKRLDAVRYLLRRGLVVADQDYDGATPLHIAAYAKSHLVVAELLQSGASPHAKECRMGRTPLADAIQSQSVECLALLLHAGADPNASLHVGDKRRSVLHMACQYSSLAIVRLLVEAGADPNSLDETGARPASWAARKENIAVLQYLIDVGCHVLAPNSEGRTPLFEAALHGARASVEFLLDKGGPCDLADRYGNTALHAAIQGSHQDVVELLMNRGARVDSKDLKKAISNTNPATIHLVASRVPSAKLCEAGIDIQVHAERAIQTGKYNLAKELVMGLISVQELPKTSINRLLMMACGSGDVDLVRRALEAGPDLITRDNVSLTTPIHLAALSGSTDILNALVRYGFGVSTETRDGQTPLHSAAYGGHIQIIKRLSGRLSVGIKDRDGALPIHQAALEGHPEAAQVLISLGSPLSPKNDKGETPLMGACKGSHAKVVELLLDSGADAGKTDGQGKTALHHAAINGAHDAMECLLSRDSSVINAVDYRGFTALHYASTRATTQLLLLNNAVISGNSQLRLTSLGIAAAADNDTLVRHIIEHYGEETMVPGTMSQLWRKACQATGKESKVFDFLIQSYECCSALDTSQLVIMLAECAASGESTSSYRISSLLRRMPEFEWNISTQLAWRLLMAACHSAWEGVVQILVDTPGIHDVCSDDGSTPLLVACKSGNPAIVEALLESGAELTAVDTNSGMTVLQLVKDSGELDIIKILEEYERFELWRSCSTDQSAGDNEGFFSE